MMLSSTHFFRMRRDLTTALIPFVYFISGAVSIAGVASTFFYKDELGLTPAQVGLMATAFTIPWSVKPIYGLLSDRVPIWKLRRKPYLVLAGLMGSAGYFSLATWVDSFRTAFAAVMLYAVGLAISDVIADGIVAEKSKTQKKAGKLQVLCRASLMTGALIVAYLSGVLVEKVGVRNVFMITGFLPLLISVFAFFIEEKAEVIQNKINFRETWQNLKKAISPEILWAALFLFIWRSTPSTGGAYSYFIIDQYGFDAEFFGRITLISRIGAICGIVFFRKFLLNIPIRTLFVWIAFVGVLFGLPNLMLVYGLHTKLGMSAEFFTLADEFISAPLTEVFMIPMLVLIARVCPKGIEATMFALLASITNIGLTVSDLGGAWLNNYFDVRQAIGDTPANYDNLHIVLWIAVLSGLIPLVLVNKVPDVRAASETDDLPEVVPSGVDSPVTKDEQVV